MDTIGYSPRKKMERIRQRLKTYIFHPCHLIMRGFLFMMGSPMVKIKFQSQGIIYLLFMARMITLIGASNSSFAKAKEVSTAARSFSNRPVSYANIVRGANGG